MKQTEKYAIIGAGPSGLACAKTFLENGIPFEGYERASEVGGLWNIHSPYSTVYESAHLISSKRMTEFTDFPMKDSVADYPHHSEMLSYFQDFAKHFGIKEHYHFNTSVQKLEPNGEGWLLETDQGIQRWYKGVVIANGTLSEPNIPQFPGTFSGEIMHSRAYKSPDIFAGKRVLIVGAGNSGCDIAVDAVHRAKEVHISLRRGYHFVPKYAFGKPADMVGGKIRLPRPLKQKLDQMLVKLFTGDPEKLGFQKPDHKMYETHPIVNSLILHYAGHGDLAIHKNIERFDGQTAHFVDGTETEVDLVMLATGYKLHYPFIDKHHLNWEDGSIPQLYLNIFHPRYDNLFVLGMIEATGIGWQGRAAQSELVAKFIRSSRQPNAAFQKFKQRKRNPLDLSGGYAYMKVPRMAYYVHKQTYLKQIKKHVSLLSA